MYHGINMFTASKTNSDGWAALWFIGGFLSIVATVALIFGVGLGFVGLVAMLPWIFLTYGLFGHCTARADVTETEQRTWDRYKALPKDKRKAIGMSPGEFARMNKQQRNEVCDYVSQIEQVLTNRNDGRILSPELRTAFAAVLEKEKSAYEHEKNVKAELTERGWNE